MTLRKLIDEGLLISAQDGYKLSDRYYEIVKKTTVNVTGQKDDTINVQLLDINKLTERQTIIYNSIKEGVQLNVQLNTTDLSNKLSIGFKTMQRELKVIENLGLIVRVGSRKTGHWELIKNIRLHMQCSLIFFYVKEICYLAVIWKQACFTSYFT